MIFLTKFKSKISSIISTLSQNAWIFNLWCLFQKYTNVLIFWSRLYTGKIKTWKVQRGTSKMVLFHVKNLTVSLSLL